jgi:hypothetical protein
MISETFYNRSTPSLVESFVNPLGCAVRFERRPISHLPRISEETYRAAPKRVVRVDAHEISGWVALCATVETSSGEPATTSNRGPPSPSARSS